MAGGGRCNITARQCKAMQCNADAYADEDADAEEVTFELSAMLAIDQCGVADFVNYSSRGCCYRSCIWCHVVIGQQGGYFPPRNTVAMTCALTVADCGAIHKFIPNTVEVDQNSVKSCTINGSVE